MASGLRSPPLLLFASAACARTATIDLLSGNDDFDDANFFVDNCSVVATIRP